MNSIKNKGFINYYGTDMRYLGVINTLTRRQVCNALEPHLSQHIRLALLSSSPTGIVRYR